MKKLIEQRKEFNKVMDLPSNSTPTLLSKERWELQRNMLIEEIEEYDEACRDLNIVEIADALGDTLYVLIGAIEEHGLSGIIEKVMNEIHASNMSKVGPSGNVIKDDSGKVMKPANYFKPDIKSIIETHWS